MSEQADPTIVHKIKPREDIKPPPEYNIIYINDEVTTQEFVVETLIIFFDYARESADEMTMKIHTDGSAIVATMPYELAEQKGVEVSLLARSNGFPLIVKLEPSN
jgi:ATP-dependent Clp protease adaptor protein ClpS